MKKKILITDDDRFFRASLAAALRRRGLDVIECENGNQASQHLESDDYDLIVTDLFMDGGDGIEFLFRLREQGTAVPAVAISSDLRYLGFAARIPGVRALHKPIRPEQILELV